MIVTIIAFAIPMLFWVGSALVATVVLRKGLKNSIPVILSAGIVAVLLAVHGYAMALLSLIGTIIMANCLRKTSSWIATLMLLIPFSTFITWLVVMYMSPEIKLLITTMKENNPEVYHRFIASNTSMSNEEIKSLLILSIMKTYVFGALVTMVISLAMARNWQAKLYNPGGFKTEIISLRMPVLLSVSLLLLWLLSTTSNMEFLNIMQPGFAIPLLFTGIALGHGVASIKKSTNSIFIVVATYLLLVIVYPLVLVLACCDSVMDFRGKLANKLNGSKIK